MSSVNIGSFPRAKFDNQDIHAGNILFNHSNSRPIGMGSSGELDAPIVPFHSTFDFRMAFIDFECAVHFERGMEPLIRPNMVPPSHTAAPEQLKEGEEKYDMFLADVFNLGRTLQIEIQKARVVSIYYCPIFFSLRMFISTYRRTTEPSLPQSRRLASTIACSI